MVIYSIYKITNTINNKCYIGQSINPSKRWNEHKRSNGVLSKAFIKYGLDNFTFQIIYQTNSQHHINEAEVEFINHYNSMVESEGGWGYNLEYGGKVNNKVSKETKLKLKQYHSNRPPEHLKKISKSRKGKSHSLETKQKMSKSRGGVSKTLNLMTCPHCGKSGKGGNMTRYHFTKCSKAPHSKAS